MIASLSVAVTVRYLPLPAQQGSTPQIGVDAGDVAPAGSQQQQPLQSIHVVSCESGWHAAAHAEPSPPVVAGAPSVVPDPSLGPFAPPSSLEGPPLPLVLLLQAASPTVDDAPIATMTWKSFSMFMRHTIPPMSELETNRRVSKLELGSVECSAPRRAYGHRQLMTSPKRLARIAGVLYLFVGIFGGFAEGFVDPKMYVAGNAAATAGNVVASAGLVRMGVVAHLLDGTFFVFLAMALYVLLEHVNKSVARAMLVLVALATGILCLNAVFEFESLRVATDSSYAAAFGVAGSNALVLLLLDTQHYGTLSAQVFFGLWLVPIGYLAYRSTLFPRWLGALLIVGGVCYLVDLLAAFLAPAFGRQIHAFIVVPCAVAEISMVVYLLAVGVKTAKVENPVHEVSPA
jgi:hypothetical protein